MSKISAETKVSKLAKENKVVLPLKFFPDNFYAVIVRNLPYETVPKEIEKFLQDKNIRPVRVDGLYVLRNETFGLIVLDSLENSEKACMWLNDRKIKRHKLKAHIHPDSYQRKPAGLSLDELLRSGFKEDESATKKLALLDELLEEAKILAEIRSIRQAEAERRIKQNERAALQHSNQVYSPYGSNKHRPRDNYYGRYDRYDREDKYYRHDRYERHDSGLGREHRRGSRERRVDRKRELSPVAEGRKNRSGSKHRQRSSSGSARSRERRHHQREAGEVTVSKARDGRGEKSSKRKKSPTGNGSLLQRDLAERQNDTEEIWHARGRLGSSDLLPSENGPGAAATSGTRSGHDLGLAREPGGTFLGPSYSERKTTRSTIETRATVGEGLETESPSDRTKTPKTRETGTTAASGGKTRLTEKKSPSFRY